MRRRDFIIFAGTGVSWSLAAHAQQATISRIGVLLGLPEGDPEAEKWIQALVEGLSQLGWKRDKNMRIDLRWADDPTDAQQRAKELINLRPDLIQVTTTVATAAVLRETRTIPVVFSNVSDPIGSGFVESFARPGGNATGFVNIEDTVAGKWLELLKQIAPQTSQVSVLFNPKTSPSTYYLKLLEAAAPSLGFELKPAQVSNADEIETEINQLAQQSNAGLVILPDVFTAAPPRRKLIVLRTAQRRIPAVYPLAFWAREGGLISYGIDHPDFATPSVDRAQGPLPAPSIGRAPALPRLGATKGSAEPSP
jgi:putative tryptophan/tyrosine transport system substrate-binding protein